MAVSVPTVAEVDAVVQKTARAAFSASDVRDLGGPLVYAWVRGEDVLYVGLGAYGLARPLARNHHRLADMAPGDRLLVWTWPEPALAEHAEREIIQRLRPPKNDSPVPRRSPVAKPPRRTMAVNEMLAPKFMVAEEVWTTVEETARLLFRQPKTIRNLISKHELPRRIVRQGKSKRRIMLLSQATRERLRRICWADHTPAP